MGSGWGFRPLLRQLSIPFLPAAEGGEEAVGDADEEEEEDAEEGVVLAHREEGAEDDGEVQGYDPVIRHEHFLEGVCRPRLAPADIIARVKGGVDEDDGADEEGHVGACAERPADEARDGIV